MRKALFTVALLLAAGVASAQVSVVKEVKALMKKNPAEAAQKIEAALTNPETANDPNTWQMAGDIQRAIYSEENTKMYLPAGGADTIKFYDSLMKMFEYYLKCDELEAAKVQSGELKKPKLRKKNAATLKEVRNNLAAGGGDFFNKGEHEKALKYLGLFVDVVNEPIFDDDAAIRADTLNVLYAGYATLAAVNCQNNEAVIKYGNIGKAHKEDGARTLMCMAEAYKSKEVGDSIKWLETIKEGADRFPGEEYFVGNIMDYYIQKGMVEEGLEQINKLLAVQETPYFLYVKGVLLFEKQQYDDVIATMEKVVAMDQNLVAEAYTKMGDCYFMPGQELLEKNSTLDVQDPNYQANHAKIQELYTKAMPYYEKSREKAPTNDQLWGRYLLNIYWILKSDKYTEIAKYLGVE